MEQKQPLIEGLLEEGCVAKTQLLAIKLKF